MKSSKLTEYNYYLQSSVYFREIKKINITLSENKINFVFLKGLPIYLHYTKNIPARRYSDCDILVEVKDLKKATELLKAKGYQKKQKLIGGLFSNVWIEEDWVKNFREGEVVFDVHKIPFSFLGKLGFPEFLYSSQNVNEITKDFLLQKKYKTIYKTKVPMLAQYHLLLFLATHFFTHNCKGSFRLELLYAVVKKELPTKKTWYKLLKEIEKYHCQVLVYPAFYALSVRYDRTVPQFFIYRLILTNKHVKNIYQKQIDLEKIDSEDSRLVRGWNKLVLLYKLRPFSLFV